MNLFENSATILKMVVFALMILALIVCVVTCCIFLWNDIEHDNIMALYTIGGTILTEVWFLFMFVVADMAEDISYLTRNSEQIADETRAAARTYLCPKCKGVLHSNDIPKYSQVGVCPHCNQQFSKDNIIVR